MTTGLKQKQLSRIVVKGFKSIADGDLVLESLNILIGCNGAGKSNFIQFFQLVQQMIEGNLQRFVSREGGPDVLLHFGRKTTPHLEIKLYFGDQGYLATFEPTKNNRLMFAKESFWSRDLGEREIANGHLETQIQQDTQTSLDHSILPAMQQWRVYHFHDTSETAYIKQLHNINDTLYLRPDASNLAAFLYFLQKQYNTYYQRIVKTIRLVAPFFGDFILRPSMANSDKIELQWREKGKDEPFKAHYFSDGTLRFICLATVFLQPSELQPETILVDEPELGLHPYAITLLAGLIKSVAKHKQVILSTQSVELINQFSAQDVIVVDRQDHQSVFQRLNAAKLTEWLEDYTLGELWIKNILGGKPAQ
ncbi:AAA family ATPase [Spirulina sp. CS-785/01]|uniref:AAA family ATPase n=1 Tax=Spirulina sp. CS-785/01 TaxID=3021716 RepID=UPI003FA7EAA1